MGIGDIDHLPFVGCLVMEGFGYDLTWRDGWSGSLPPPSPPGGPGRGERV